MIIKANNLKHVRFHIVEDNYEVSLVDFQGYEILKGYGMTPEDAINDLHSNLL
jgi:hypothetical protein